ncbi:hypothetical protein SAMN05444278_10297 [Psychroflexus salarius]|uniref:Group 1 truncated hemoglobin n=1 Tax=Psychroflexus salarius TaxID=1155689 RepID=A0A1M4TZA6_9FLAO|nr:hypothetical protein [Psychroflexus salarius]SHE49703.1 hypothetical protein SAMN05444278_10297 [Psychroflexus salarius]
MANYKKSLLTLLAVAGMFTACSDDDDANNTVTEQTLYDKLGGTTMVTDPNDPNKMIEQGRLSYRSVVDSTIVLIVSDVIAEEEGNLGTYFAPILAEVSAGNNTNVAVLSDNLTDFFSANTGGGDTNTYNGLNMVAAHDPEQNPRMGAKADNADYDKFVGYVGQAAALNGVTDTEIINEVVEVLESIREPIVQDPQ